MIAPSSNRSNSPESTSPARHHGRWYGDTWYPSWASDGNLYSPWTDGTTEGVTSVSIENDTDWKIATTGNAVMIGDDPENLTIKNTSPPQRASPKPFEGPLSLRQSGL